MNDQTPAETEAVKKVSLRESFWTWCRVAALSFGGPAGQIAVMHRIIVEQKKWISEERFIHALNYCMLLPGPEAQQLATYIGWLMHRTLGGLMAGVLFVLPGFVSILALSIVYTCFEDSRFVQALFFGLKPAVMAVVIDAVLRIGKRVLKNRTMVTVATASFVAIFFFDVPFPILIVSAGLIGLVGSKVAPDRFEVIKGHSKIANSSKQSVSADHFAEHVGRRPSLLRSVRVSAICMTLWFGPLVGVWLLFGVSSVYFQEGLFFSKAAVVTFGGAYSVLAYVAQQAVEKYGWLRPGEMLDGLGMAETTPGPLIMVVQFVGFMGAYRNPGPFSPLVGGIVGSILTTWVTFAPCFFWVFLGAPYIERLRGNKRLNSALSAITAAVVGVVLNLAVWFSLHTLFGKVITRDVFGLRLQVPVLVTADIPSCAVAILACLLTFYWKKGLFFTLGVSAVAGAALYVIR
ncbi:MAG: chromate efflux transporter [Pirellula sp.]|jgi:chromate transporter|nr:chromate efflux transporter [Pirellula sp.]